MSPTFVFWCKSCSAERTMGLNPEGFFAPPENWLRVFAHLPGGERKIIANACSEHCLIAVLQAMPVSDYLTAPDGVGRDRFCKMCRAHYRSDTIRAGSVSIGLYDSVGKRTFCGPFCDQFCAAEFYQQRLVDLLEAA